MSNTGSPPPPPAPDLGGDPAAAEPTPWWRRWWAITGFVVLAIIILVAVFGGGGDPEAEPTAGPSATPSPTSTTASPTPAATEAAPTEPTEAPTAEESTPDAAPTEEATSEVDAAPGTRDNPLPVGETGTLPEWEVTVDEINLDATEEVLAANEFNSDPENGNYGLVTITATYTGDEEADAGFFLSTTLAGADSRQYGDTDCFAVEPDPLLEQPTVENGGTVTGQVCLDYPDEALGDGAVIFIEETLSFTDERVFWAIPTS